MALTPPEIQHRPLKSQGRGYERRAVDDLLEEITESFDQVWQERDQLKARIEKLEEVSSVLPDSARVVHETLLAAQRVAESVRDEAKVEAESVRDEAKVETESVRDEAKVEAESVRDEAKVEAESVVAEARRFAERIVAELTSDAARLEAEIRRLETIESDMQARLESFLTAGLKLVQGIGTDQALPLATLPEHLREAAKAQAGEPTG